MDDTAFERWSQTLEALRLGRKNELEQMLQEKADSFKPSEFYQLAHRGIETVMERWLSFEQESPPVTSTRALQNIKAEMESIFEFELESIRKRRGHDHLAHHLVSGGIGRGAKKISCLGR